MRPMHPVNVNGTERNAITVSVTNNPPPDSDVGVPVPPKKRPRLNPPDELQEHRVTYTNDALLAFRDPSLRADVEPIVAIAADSVGSAAGKKKMHHNRRFTYSSEALLALRVPSLRADVSHIIALAADSVDGAAGEKKVDRSALEQLPGTQNDAVGQPRRGTKRSIDGVVVMGVEEQVEATCGVTGDVRISDEQVEANGTAVGTEDIGVKKQVDAEGSAIGSEHVGAEERGETKGNAVGDVSRGVEMRPEADGALAAEEQDVQSQVQPADDNMETEEQDATEKEAGDSAVAGAAAHASHSQHADAEKAVEGEGCSAKSGDPPRRRRYSNADILALRHTRLLHALNGYVFSRHAARQLAEVHASAGELLDDDGHLRTSDVLLKLGSAGSAAPSFADMQLPEALVVGLRAAGYVRPSPVQHRGIPLARLGADLIAQAKSGTGKTAVFTCTAVELALQAPPGRGRICTLVLTPGREVARQVADLMLDVLRAARRHLGQEPGSEVALCVGGAPDACDAPVLQGSTVVVGTPARVRALLVKRILDPAAIRLLILDEADRLLDAGAGFGLGAVAALLPHARQSMAFSATYTPALLARLRALMRAPRLVWLGDEPAATAGGGDASMARAAVLRGVRQLRVDVNDDAAKRAAVLAVARGQHRAYTACIAFVSKREAARDVARRLKKGGVATRHVTAALTNAQRRDALQAFKQRKAKVLVATDMLARGMSFDHCDLVLHVDVPADVATYLHRVGRAGRFGTQGTSVVLVDKSQRADMAAIEAHIGKVPRVEVAVLSAVKANAQGGEGGREKMETAVDEGGQEKMDTSVEAQKYRQTRRAQVKAPVAEGEASRGVTPFPTETFPPDDGDNGRASSQVGAGELRTHKVDAIVGRKVAASTMDDARDSDADGDVSSLEEAGYAAGYALAKRMIAQISRRLERE